MAKVVELAEYRERKRLARQEVDSRRTTNYLRLICQGREQELIKEHFVPDEPGDLKWQCVSCNPFTKKEIEELRW